ncbi:hypothetical protein ABE237_22590 [Brevibacillus formosus]|uniref:hypothetical protein n=1 Tax=Brevibacillus formosus TaxID=54913 RepID=UPI0018CECC27|nr:hypothetical protein [Brevibacillus formosus]MBG9941762.1 hypothetical protein [Brevibacillus formosus]
MAKRRYYREERRLPRYIDEMDDDLDDDDTSGRELTENNVRTGFWAVLAVLTLGMALSVAQTVYTPSADTGGNYRVVSVSHGRLHTVDTITGERVSFPDPDLVKAALGGKLKHGDVIHR